MSTLHSFCANHAQPEAPFHTPERWWLELGDGSEKMEDIALCDVCAGPARWLKLDYTQEATQ